MICVRFPTRTRLRALWQLLFTFENETAATTGWPILSAHVCVGLAAGAPLASWAWLTAKHEMRCGPRPATGIFAVAVCVPVPVRVSEVHAPPPSEQ